MDIKKYIEDLLYNQGETDAEVIEIYKTGSQLFKENPKDLDYYIVCSKYDQRVGRDSVKIGDIQYDFFIFDETAIAAQQDFSDEYYIDSRHKKFAYFSVLKDVLYSKRTHNWNMLDHEEEYKRYLKNDYLTTKVTTSKRSRYKPGKFMVHYYLVLKIFDNKKVELTEDMKKDVLLLYSNTEESYPIMDWILDELDKIDLDE